MQADKPNSKDGNDASKIAPFYLIVDSAELLRDFLPLGLKTVQLRIKDTDEEQLRREIRLAKSLCSEYACQLIINDFWQLAIDEGCDYIHLGQEDLQQADINTIRQHGLKLGISTHDSSELQIALDHDPDYIALGPIYQTLLKKMKWRPQGLEKLQRWKSRIGNIPLVAIGGLTPERVEGVFAHGADSACVVTDVLQHQDPIARVSQWLQECSEQSTNA